MYHIQTGLASLHTKCDVSHVLSCEGIGPMQFLGRLCVAEEHLGRGAAPSSTLLELLLTTCDRILLTATQASGNSVYRNLYPSTIYRTLLTWIRATLNTLRFPLTRFIRTYLHEDLSNHDIIIICEDSAEYYCHAVFLG